MVSVSVGENVAFAPAGRPDTLSEAEAVKPFVRVTRHLVGRRLSDPDRQRDGGLTETAKSGAGVIVTVAEPLTPPLDAVAVNGPPADEPAVNSPEPLT